MGRIGPKSKSMLENLFSPNLDNYQRAMNRATERQGLLMTNMANINVPGYKRKDVDFHVALQGQIAQQYGMDMNDKVRQDASDQTSLRVDGNNVDMEKEVGSIHETELHFEAITNMTTQYFSDLKSAIREGK